MNLDRIINQLFPSEADGSSKRVHTGSLATGAALGGVAGFLANSSTGRRWGRSAMRAGRSAAGIGGLALVGTIAYKALTGMKNCETGEQQVPPAQPASAESPNGLLVLRAMIASAYADGVLDDQEHDRILGRLHDMDLEADERRLVLAEIENPVSIDDLARQCVSTEDCVSVYAASRLVLTVDCEEEEAYLERLGRTLALPKSCIESIEAEVRASEEAA